MSNAISAPIIEGLWNESVTVAEYGASEEQYYSHLFKQYEITIEMADRISARRNLANTFFLTLNTLLLGAAGFAYEKGPTANSPLLNIFPLAAALAICYLWYRLLESYRQLNSAKYKVIGEYEKKLPTSPFWEAEWINGLGEGKEPSLYRQLTSAEKIVPVIFAIIYLVSFFAILLPGAN